MDNNIMNNNLQFQKKNNDCKNVIMVSVFCATYNHAKYLRRCLDGLIMQKTNFKYDIIVHDDASTDNTADIIREYEKKYPELIKPIYQRENQYVKGFNAIKKYILKEASGKYIAFCEGDDFWIDKNKLQKQFDALENNQNCKMCVSTVRGVKESGEKLDKTFPSEIFASSILSPEDVLRLLSKEYCFQTSSFFVYTDEYKKTTEHFLFQNIPVDDWPTLLYFSQIGYIYYLSDEMSCYRIGSISSFTERQGQASLEQQNNYHLDMVKMIDKFNEMTNNRYYSFCKTIKDRFYYYIYRNLLTEKNYKEIIKNSVFKKFLEKEKKVDRYMIKCSYYCPWLVFLYNKIKGHY